MQAMGSTAITDMPMFDDNLSTHIKNGSHFDPYNSWKNDRIFTGSNPCYPVELFVELIEGEAELFQHQQSRISTNAWCLIHSSDRDSSDHDSSNRATPAGVWKAKMSAKYDDKTKEGVKWTELKSDLLEAFGRKQPYNVVEKLALLQSLTKGHVESFRTYLLRVKWVLSVIDQPCSKTWTKLLFLLGLSRDEQEAVTDKADDKNVTELCEIIDGSTSSDSLPVKVEVEEDGSESLNHVLVGQDEYRTGDVLYHDEQLQGFEEASSGSHDESRPLVARKKRTKRRLASKTSIHACPECGEVFQRRLELNKHMAATHNNNKSRDIHYCGICNLKFTGVNEWDEHEKANHLDACAICSLVISDLESMRKHHKVDHKGKQTLCPSCKVPVKYNHANSHKCKKKSSLASIAQGTESRSLRRDLRTHVLQEGESPGDVRAMTSHIMGVANGISTWYCAYCLDEFLSFKELRLHTHSAHAGKKFRCDICFDYKSRKLDTIVIHKIKVHNAVTDTFKLVKCEVENCNFSAVRESALALHFKMAHSEDYSGTTCGVCGKRFPAPSNVKAHVESVHMRIKRFQCDLCDERFLHHQKMIEHKNDFHAPGGPLPKGVKHVMCPYCGIRLRSEFTLKNHVRRKHGEGEEPQECSVCGRMLSCKSSLSHHIRTMHEKDKHFSCPKCSKKFATKYRQKHHIRVAHMNVKPFHCGICSNSYVRAKDCAQHVASKHENWSKERTSKEWKLLIDSHPAIVKKDEPPAPPEEETAVTGSGDTYVNDI